MEAVSLRAELMESAMLPEREEPTHHFLLDGQDVVYPARFSCLASSLRIVSGNARNLRRDNDVGLVPDSLNGLVFRDLLGQSNAEGVPGRV